MNLAGKNRSRAGARKYLGQGESTCVVLCINNNNATKPLELTQHPSLHSWHSGARDHASAHCNNEVSYTGLNASAMGPRAAASVASSGSM